MTALTIDRHIDFGSLCGFSEPSSYVLSWDKVLIDQYSPRSASISSSVNTALTFLLSRDIYVEDSLGVENFLANYYGIVAYLYEVPEKISEHFGKSGLKLGLFSDPESGDGQTELFLEVETALSPEDANERLSKINRQWLLASKDQDLLSLNITLRFV